MGDFKTSIRDNVGGRSGTWENIISRTYNELIAELLSDAYKKGTNGIMGLKIGATTIAGRQTGNYFVLYGYAMPVTYRQKI